MSMPVVMPSLQAAIVCEDVRREVAGMQTLVGVMPYIPAPGLPLVFHKLCLWTRWCNGFGEFTQRARILAPDEEKIVAEASVQFRLDHLDAHTTTVHMFGGVQFREPGVHHVEILCDQHLASRFPLAVVLNAAER